LSPRTRTVPDYILTSERIPKLVSVRPKVSSAQRHDLQEWQKVFGTNHEVIRVWPIKNGNGWAWTAEVIVTAATCDYIPAADDPAVPSAESENDTIDDAGSQPQQTVVTGRTPEEDFTRFSNRLELIEGELEGVEFLLRELETRQRQLREDLNIWRDQFQRARRDSHDC